MGRIPAKKIKAKKITTTIGFKGFKYCKHRRKYYCQPSMEKVFYSIGKEVKVEGEIIPCKNGIHFCETLTDVFNFYSLCGNNFFGKVQTSDKVISHGNTMKKLVTSSLTLTEIYDNATVLKMVGYKRTGGAKKIKNLNSMTKRSTFNTPNEWKAFYFDDCNKGEVVYYKNNLKETIALITKVF